MESSKLLIYELNEIPRKLIDYYIEIKPNCSFKKIIDDGLILNTFTNDEGELHPWSTWPTVHRGVSNQKHNIRFINQDLTKSIIYPPIWEILLKGGVNIGIFGSLQSYPPIDHKKVDFYLPDTFAPKPSAYPRELKNFQKFNLNLVGHNKAISRNINKKQILQFLGLKLRNIISNKSFFKTFSHILKELFFPKYKTRRSLLQPVLSFDLYFKYLEKKKPGFSTYFTNHLAGAMHRYWKHLFPKDFNLSSSEVNDFNAKSVIKAMDIADQQLGRLLKFCKKNNYDFWIISSMGQKAIERGEYIPELILIDLNKLLREIKLDTNLYLMLPAMQPDICISAKDNDALNKLRSVFSEIYDSSGKNIFKEIYKPTGLKLNFSINRSKHISKDRYIVFKDKKIPISSLGFELIVRDIGTAYHTPEGIMIINGKNSLKNINSKFGIIDTRRIAPSIVKFFGLKKPSYMLDPI